VKVLIWQWGRRGAGPLCAVAFARELARAGATTGLCLSAQSELVITGAAPTGTVTEPTYDGIASLLARLATAPFAVGPLARRIAALAPDAALCAMPAALDLLMAAALRQAGVPFAVAIHDADPHPGEAWLVQMRLQRALARRADAVVALSGHVAARLEEQGVANGPRLIRASLPPLAVDDAPPPFAHGGRARLLCFGRLLPYKGLDLLAAAMRAVPAGTLELRVVGSGPDGADLAALRALPDTVVENRWVPEEAVAGLLAWADALILPYREASQSGVAAAALAMGRFVIATRVGGIPEQLAGQKLARVVAPEAPAIAAAIARFAAERPHGVAAPGYDVAPLLAGLARIAGAPG
jgi:glycosyltransferase involved in cell wall biosynthesis